MTPYPARPARPGERFGQRVVIREVNPKRTAVRAYRRVEVRCDCGKVDTINLQPLRAGRSTSCASCAQWLLTPTPVHPGDRYGLRVVVREVERSGGHKGRRVLVRCNCGREDVVSLGQLQRGQGHRCRDCRSTHSN